MAAVRIRSKNFESCEIQLLTDLVEDHIGVLNSKLTNSVTNDKKKQIWDKITADINSLGVSNRTSKEIKTKWNNMFQNAKKEFSGRKLQTKKTGGGPCPKPVSSSIEKIMDIYSDSAYFNGVDGVESPVPLQEAQSVEIYGSPTTLDLLSRVLQEQQENDVVVPSLDAEVPIASCSYTADIAAVSSLQSSVDSKSVDEDGVTASTKGKGSRISKWKVKPADVTQLQYEVLLEQKKKLIAETTYYELMNKKLRKELANC